MNNPWTFGWAQVLTLIGFAITALIAIFGFRTFARWKREKVEEMRIGIAFEALAAAYKARYVFDHIRGALVSGYEWADMPVRPETEGQRSSRGVFYAVLSRIRKNKDFFDHVWDLQPKCMAMFGKDIEGTFLLLHKSRRHIEVACEMLSARVDEDGRGDNPQTRELYQQLRRDMSDHGDFEPEKDRVRIMLTDFVEQMEKVCRPVIDRSFKSAL